MYWEQCTTYFNVSEINEETLSGVELVPPGVREDLRAIAAWLDKHNNTDRLTVYAKLRSDALSQSLKVRGCTTQKLAVTACKVV